MSAWTKEVIGRGGYVFLRGVKQALKGRSNEQVHLYGARLGRIFGNTFKKRRQKLIENLSIALPELDEAEKFNLSTKVFEHFGMASADFLASEGRSLAELQETTDIGNLTAAFDEALSRGKGALMVSGHLGNWERIPAILSLLGYPTTVIIRDANSPGINELVNQLREAPGTKVLPRGNATRTMIERLRKNEIVGLLPDQNADDAFLPFFGLPTGTAMGLGVLAERTGAAVVPTACIHLGKGQYRVETESNFRPASQGELKGEATMRSVHAWLESTIRAHPDQWLWFHDRWRSARERGLV